MEEKEEKESVNRLIFLLRSMSCILIVSSILIFLPFLSFSSSFSSLTSSSFVSSFVSCYVHPVASRFLSSFRCCSRLRRNEEEGRDFFKMKVRRKKKRKKKERKKGRHREKRERKKRVSMAITITG